VWRVARPGLLPPRRLSWTVTGALVALAVAWPAALGPEADVFRLADRAPFDVFYAFWFPVTQVFPPWSVWLWGSAFSGLLLATPLWARPRVRARPGPSVVNERSCTGCTQCFLDCPYEAIAMVTRADGREELVARVDPNLCVSCGICAGSCAPMGVGPPGRTGRHQLGEVKEYLADRALGGSTVVLVACRRGAGGVTDGPAFERAPVFPVDCAGSMHTSVIEYLVRSGAGGVLIVSCPPRDCWNREGPKWLEQRLFHDREAELKARVDRRRVRLAYAGLGEPATVRTQLLALREEVLALAAAEREERIDLELECDPPPAPAASR